MTGPTTTTPSQDTEETADDAARLRDELAAARATIRQHEAEWAHLRQGPGLADTEQQAGASVPVPRAQESAAAIRRRLDQAIADALPEAGGSVLSALERLAAELVRADARRAASGVSVRRADEARVQVAPSQGQDIPPEQLAALITGLHLPVVTWTPLHLEQLRHALRQAYRVGFAAALGYPIEVAPAGDGLRVGDRPGVTGDQGDDAEPEQRQRRRIGLAPRVRAALDAQEAAHDWQDRTDLTPWPSCRRCGVVQRRDGGTNSPCSGPKHVELREGASS